MTQENKEKLTKSLIAVYRMTHNQQEPTTEDLVDYTRSATVSAIRNRAQFWLPALLKDSNYTKSQIEQKIKDFDALLSTMYEPQFNGSK